MRPNLSWTLDPVPIIAAAAVGAAYLRRFMRVRRSRATRAAADAPAWRLACFAAALWLALGAVVSPLDSLADQLFCMHMLQHVLLLDLVPILAIVGLTKVLLRPLTRAVRGLERRAAQRRVRVGDPSSRLMVGEGIGCAPYRATAGGTVGELNDIVQRLERLLDARVRIESMDLIQIDVVGSQTTKRGVDCVQHVRS